MKLSKWLKVTQVTQKDFVSLANEKGYDISTHAIAKWCQGQRIPRKEEMECIYKVTDGTVQPNDFYNLQ
tara:strand:+ start:329 stop:535 length:207 start_codon:yes stop_codon:yes gene_type:complete